MDEKVITQLRDFFELVFQGYPQEEIERLLAWEIEVLEEGGVDVVEVLAKAKRNIGSNDEQ